jgi:predicted DNA-binding protein
VWAQPPSKEALVAFIDGLAELIATDLLRRIRDGDESLLSERVGNELHVGLKSTSKPADGG